MNSAVLISGESPDKVEQSGVSPLLCRAVYFMLSSVFFVSGFDVISSVSAVDMFANLCLNIFLLGSVF